MIVKLMGKTIWPLITVEPEPAQMKALQDGDTIFSDSLARETWYNRQKSAATSKQQAFRGWQYNCIHHIAVRAASVATGLELFKQEGKKKREIESHIFYDLWSRPNKLLYGFAFCYVMFAQVDSIGRCVIWHPLNKRGRPEFFWPLTPSRLTVRENEAGDSLIYDYVTKNGIPRSFGEDEILDLRWPNPFAIASGMSVIDAQNLAVDVAKMLEEYEWIMFKEGARPDYVISPKEGSWEKDDARKFKRQWTRDFGGLIKRADVAVPLVPIEINKINWSNEDLQFQILSTYFKELIQGGYGVPDLYFGQGDTQNRATAWVMDMRFNRDVIKPRLDLVLGPLNNEILPLYDPRIVAEFPNPVPDDEEFQRETDRMELEKGAITINEYRAKTGRDPVPWGNVPLVSITTVPLGADIYGTRSDKSIEKALTKEDRRIARWKAFAVKQTAWERRLMMSIRSLFAKQKDAVLEKVDSFIPKILGAVAGMSHKILAGWLKHEGKDLIDVLVDLSEYDEETRKEIMQIVEAQIAAAAAEALEETGAVISFNADDPRVREFIGMTLEKIKDINRTTENQLRRALQEGIRAGEGATELSDRIMNVFDQASRGRALTIARTETVSAQNFATVEGWQQSQAVPRKEWLTAPGAEHPRHELVEVLPVNINDDFYVDGEYLSFPGDPKGSPENTINCRCAVAPILEGE